jgi:hypothetical protein
MLFFWMFHWFPHLHKPTITTGDIHLFGVKLTQDKAIRCEDLEFIADQSNNLSQSPKGDDSSVVAGAWPIACHRYYMPSLRKRLARMIQPRARERAPAFLSQGHAMGLSLLSPSRLRHG